MLTFFLFILFLFQNFLDFFYFCLMSDSFLMSFFQKSFALQSFSLKWFAFLFNFFKLIFGFLEFLSELRCHRNLRDSFVLLFENFLDCFFLLLKFLKLILKNFDLSLLTGDMLIIVNVFKLPFFVSNCVLNSSNFSNLLGNESLFQFNLFGLLIVIDIDTILFLFGIRK